MIRLDDRDSDAGLHFERTLPVALRPNRGPNFALVGIFLLVVGFIVFEFAAPDFSLFGLSVEPGRASDPPTEKGMPWLAVAIFVAVAVLGVGREFLYFSDGSSYYVELSSVGITINTPFKRRRFAWGDLARFKVSASRTGRRGRSKLTYSVKADLRDGGWFRSGVSLSQNDFAHNLAGSRSDSADALCAFLNEVRDRVREAEGAGREIIVPVPYGLHVVDLPNKPNHAGRRDSEVAEREDAMPMRERPKTEISQPDRTPTVIRE